MNPLWMIKTRFQLIADTSVGQRAFRNYQDVAQTILREEGPPGFFKGITASYVGCFEGAIQWVVYEKLKTLLSRPRLPAVGTGVSVVGATSRMSTAANGMKSTTSAKQLTQQTQQRTPTPVEYFAAAALSKCVAVLATYPHEVVRTRLREQASNGAFKYRGFLGALTTIAKEEGAK